MRPFIGVLRVVGTNVRLNGQPVTSGTSVYGGDEVTTGAASSAVVELGAGGFVQLDESTDPVFELEAFFDFLRGARCIVVTILKGQALIEGDTVCVGTPHATLFFRSTVNVLVSPDHAVVTVLGGSARIVTPVDTLVGSGQQVTIAAGATGPPPMVALTADRLQAVTDWRQKFGYRTEPPTAAPPAIAPPAGPPPTRAAPPERRAQPGIAGVLGGAGESGAGQVTVPALEGRSVGDARKVLADQGLKPGRVAEDFTGRALAGAVLRQQPPAGTAIARGAAVDLVIESARVVVTRDNAKIVIDILNAVTQRLNAVIGLLNQQDDAGAARGLEDARAEFQRLDRTFQEASGGAELRRLSELAATNRETQRRMLGAIQAMIDSAGRRDQAGFERAGREYDAQRTEHNQRVGDMQRIIDARWEGVGEERRSP